MSGHPLRPTVLDVVMAYLRGRPGQPFCDGCLAEEITTPRGSLATVVLQLEQWTGFRRAQGWCSVCNRRRIVTVALAPSRVSDIA